MELKKKLIVMFLIFAVAPLALLGSFSYYKSSEIILEQARQTISENLTQVNYSLNYFVRDIEQLSLYIYGNDVIQEVLSKDPDRDPIEKHQDQKAINGILESFLGIKNWDISIYLLGENGDRYFTGALLPHAYREYDVNWGLFRNAKQADGNIVWDTHYVMKKIDDFGVVLSSGRMLKNIETNEPLGYLVIDIMEPDLADKYSKAQLFPGGEVFLLDNSGYVISSIPSKHQVGTKLDEPFLGQVLDGKKGYFKIPALNNERSRSMVIYDTSDFTGFKLINVVPISALTQKSKSIRNLTFVIIAMCLLFALWLAFYLSNNITRPLRKLGTLMKKVEEGNMDISFAAKSNDEIGQLANSFNTMLQRIKQLINEVYEKQVKLHEVELKMIQAQFNPHFLYNALDSINWMARIHKMDDISKTVVSLGELLRFSIQRDGEMITVSEEMKHIKNYLTVQNLRYRDKFEAIIDIDPSIQDYYMPKLLLQPIVENAITHGLEMKEDKGTLTIRGHEKNGQLQFTIEDDGVGMDTSSPSHAHKTESHKTGIGLENIMRRLQLHFGDDYEFQVQSRLGVGTTVKIEIPILTEKEEDHV